MKGDGNTMLHIFKFNNNVIDQREYLNNITFMVGDQVNLGGDVYKITARTFTFNGNYISQVDYEMVYIAKDSFDI
jgi:hypothetical protein